MKNIGDGERGETMPFEIVRNDITNMQVDAIVNTANPKAIVGSGVDAAIHKKAGSELLKARKKIGSISVGDAAITPAFDLDANYVIHVVGPVWKGGNQNEEALLSQCYKGALELAKEHKCESIAFPLISTGAFGYPKAPALQIAIKEFSSFLMENDMQIYLVVFSRDAFELSEKLFRSVKSYIDENYIRDKIVAEYGLSGMSFEDEAELMHLRREIEIVERDQLKLEERDWKFVLNRIDAGFSETLLRLIDLSGKKDSEIYKKANIDRRLFSKIRNNTEYQPSKTTALAFAIALELDLEETRDFIARAGFALSHSSKFDVIVEYFIINNNYDMFELNEVLFAFDQPLIGA